jgi:hypothetical protein
MFDLSNEDPNATHQRLVSMPKALNANREHRYHKTPKNEKTDPIFF